jgi:hypothetical protein
MARTRRAKMVRFFLEHPAGRLNRRAARPSRPRLARVTRRGPRRRRLRPP